MGGEPPAIEVQYAVAGNTLPPPDAIRHWVSHALQGGIPVIGLGTWRISQNGKNQDKCPA